MKANLSHKRTSKPRTSKANGKNPSASTFNTSRPRISGERCIQLLAETSQAKESHEQNFGKLPFPGFRKLEEDLGPTWIHFIKTRPLEYIKKFANNDQKILNLIKGLRKRLKNRAHVMKYSQKQKAETAKMKMNADTINQDLQKQLQEASTRNITLEQQNAALETKISNLKVIIAEKDQALEKMTEQRDTYKIQASLFL